MNKVILTDLGENEPNRYKLEEISEILPNINTSILYLIGYFEGSSTVELEHCTVFNPELTGKYITQLVFAKILALQPDNRVLIQYDNDTVGCNCQQSVPIECLAILEINKVSKITSVAPFSIGSDIEFHFVKDGVAIGSGSGLARSSSGEIGTDHGGTVGEIRPQYSMDPISHSDNIKSTLKKLIQGKMLNENVFVDSSHLEEVERRSPVGGHIHFGIKNVSLIREIAANLDYWLLPTIAPLFPKKTFKHRISSSYGKIGGESIRTNDHGFEYRLIPSFIFDEGITRGILCLAYAIAKLTSESRLKTRIKEKDQNWIKRFYDSYNSHDLDGLSELRNENIRKLLNKNLMGGYIKYIFPLFEAIEYNAEFSGDIAEGWQMDYNYNVLNSRNQEIDRNLFRIVREGFTIPSPGELTQSNARLYIDPSENPS